MDHFATTPGMGKTDLPVEALRPEVDALLGGHHLVISAPTGSGKSTRVPVWCAEATGRPVLVVEPRRVACRSLARWVSAQVGETLGEGVGYTVRFEDVAGARTRIRFVTPGVALQYAAGAGLEAYGTLILDEFHERGLETDLFLAAARRLRPDARLIVMSATLDGDRIARFLDGRWLRAEGRMFPVTLRYLGGPTVPSGLRLAQRVVEGVRRALSETAGSVLVFLPGKGEIADCLARLHGLHGAEVLPLHGTLTNAEQDRAFDTGGRRVILSTNVAETSITLPGVTAVVDAGLVRQRVHRGGHSALSLVPISLASAEQRRGRAGRVSPGTCYRLWEERAVLERETPPQVLREDLMQFVLAVAAAGFRPQELQFLDAPPEFAVARAQESLRSWAALDASDHLTEFGRRLFQVPVDADLARLLLNAPAGLRRDVADLIAALESRAPLFGRPRSADGTDEDASADEGGPRCDATRMILALRRDPSVLHGTHSDALAECRRIADQLRSLYGLPTLDRDPGPRAPDRPALLAYLLREWRERAYVRRRGGSAWGNGRDEVTLGGGRPSRGRRGARDAGKEDDGPQAALILDIEAVGDGGLRTQLRARHAMPCTFTDLRAAGLGRPRPADPALVEGQVVADVTVEYAGREIGRETQALSGALLREALADLILAGRVLRGVAPVLLDDVAAWNLHRTLQASMGSVGSMGSMGSAGGPQSDASARPPYAQHGALDREPMEPRAWLVQRLERLGVEGPEDWLLLAAEDLRFEGLDAAERAELDRRYPRTFSSGQAMYVVEYEPRARVVTLHWQSGIRGAALRESMLPRWSGWAVKLNERGRLVALR